MSEICSNFNTKYLEKFAPCIRDNILKLCLNSRIVLCGIKSSDITAVASQHVINDVFTNFKFKIPYAGKFLEWELIFNPEDYSFAPDFDFNDNYFMENIDIDTVCDNIPSLGNWDVKNDDALSLLLNDLILYFKKIQYQRLKNENVYSRIFNEFCALTPKMGLTEKDVELLAENNSVHCLIRMNIDFSALPEYAQPPDLESSGGYLNPGEDYANLKISFMKLDCTRVTTALQLSPRAEQVLGNSKSFSIPNFSKDTSLADYVPYIDKLLHDRIGMLVHHFNLKKEYITCLATMRRESLVEYDAVSFAKAHFICEIDDYFCLIKVEIGKTFPMDKPTVSLCSFYCLDNKKACVEVLENYPFSSRWRCDEMIKKLLMYLEDVLPKFKTHTH